MNEPADELAPENSRVVHWAGPLFVAFSVVLVPWTVYLGLTLPPRSVSGHYAIAWAGFDVLLAGSLLGTGWSALRRSPWLAVTATVTATLLVVDAWFDVLTSSEKLDVVQAAVLAVVVELPLAAVCGWLAVHSEELEQRRLTLALGVRRRSLSLGVGGRAVSRPGAGRPPRARRRPPGL